MRRKLIAAVVLLAFLLVFGVALAEQYKYCASVKRAPFHYTWCEWAKKISEDNIKYYPTREAAIEDGHRPCKVCKP